MSAYAGSHTACCPSLSLLGQVYCGIYRLQASAKLFPVESLGSSRVISPNLYADPKGLVCVAAAALILKPTLGKPKDSQMAEKGWGFIGHLPIGPFSIANPVWEKMPFPLCQAWIISEVKLAS